MAAGQFNRICYRPFSNWVIKAIVLCRKSYCHMRKKYKKKANILQERCKLWYDFSMKLKSVLAFEKQLREAAPVHFSKIYVVLVSDPFERKFYVQKLFSFLSHYKPKLVFRNGEEFLEEGLFSEERLVHLESERDLKHLAQDVTVVFSGEKCSNSFYTSIEKEVVCLDLTGEKPWEKKERQLEELQKIVKQGQKTISLQVANRLIEQVGSDFATLKNEVEKLLLFVGDRKSIEEKDIETITKSEKEVTAWQIAEALVWKSKGIKRQEFKDLSEVLALIALVRHHLYLGIQICRGGEMPNLRKNQMELYLPFCQKVGSLYFMERLTILFEWEVKAKSNSFDATTLWDLIVIHYDTLSTTEFASSRS